MTIAFPIRGPTSPAAAAALAPAGFRLTLPVRPAPAGGILAPLLPTASAPALAVTAAAALDDPEQALLLARLARERPEEALALDYNDLKVDVILASVRDAQDDQTIQFDLTAEVRAAAAAVGASPRLVAAAAESIGVPVDPADPDPSSPGQNARRWAAALGNAEALDRAARAALRAGALELLDVEQDIKVLQTRVTELRRDLRQVTLETVALRADVDALKAGIP